MKLRTYLTALVFALLPACLFAQPAPLGRAEILGRLALGYSPSYIAQLVKTHGTNFSPTAEFLSRVKLAGGEGILVDRLSSSDVPPGVNLSTVDRPFEHLANCAELIHSGAAEKAEMECRAAIEENPESAWPIMAAIRVLAENGVSQEEQLQLLRRAVAAEPGLVIAHRSLAMADLPPQEQAQEMQKVAALEQQQPDEQFGSVGAFTGVVPFRGTSEPGNLSPEAQKSTRTQIQSTLQEHPDIATIHTDAAFKYAQLGDTENAQSELREALRLEPGNVDLHLALASFHQFQQHTEAELAEYREAIRIAPYQNLPRLRLTEALAREQRSEEAIREWNDYLVLSPRDLAASNSLINLYLARHDRKSAIAELRRSLKASSLAIPDEATYVDSRLQDLDRLAHLLTDNGESDSAAEQYSFLLRFKPDSSVLHNNLGNVFYAQRHCDQATGEYREALRLQPDLPDAHHNLANCLLVMKNMDEAIAEYRQTIELDPDKFQSRLMLGAALAQKGELNAAVEQFQQILAQDPQNADALASLGHAYYLNKDIPSAILELKQALALKPDFPAAENELAWIFATSPDPKFRDPAQALLLARKAVQSSPQPVPAILDTLAEALLLNAKPVEALATETQATSLDPKNVELQSRLTHFRQAANPPVSPTP
jgi:tetratricopeptide (TPR) repeat protein